VVSSLRSGFGLILAAGRSPSPLGAICLRCRHPRGRTPSPSALAQRHALKGENDFFNLLALLTQLDNHFLNIHEAQDTATSELGFGLTL